MVLSILDHARHKVDVIDFTDESIPKDFNIVDYLEKCGYSKLSEISYMFSDGLDLSVHKADLSKIMKNK